MPEAESKDQWQSDPQGNSGPPPHFYLLYKTPMSSTEKDTDKVTFLSLKLSRKQAKFGQWVLLAQSFIMFLVALLLACRLHSMVTKSLAQDTSRQNTTSSQNSSKRTPPPNAYFLGIAMAPSQVAKRQWILLGLCLVGMLCSISLAIWIFTQHKRKPLWMRAEW